MKKSHNIIQFIPYFTPHIGGVEKVSEGIFSKWTQGKSLIYSGNKGQQGIVYNKKQKSNVDKYVKMFFPSFDIIDNFPVPQLWTSKYRSSHKDLKEYIGEYPNENFTVITHTRFFLSSLLGGLFARRNNIRWIHIEHGSNYVLLSSNLKNKIAYLYDKTIGKWIFKNADKIVCISESSKKFVKKQVDRKDISVWYRGMDKIELQTKKVPVIEFVYIGRLVTLKGVSDLLEAFSGIQTNKKLTLIGDGPERIYLEKQAQSLGISKKVTFLGSMTHQEVCSFLAEKKCILVNPSYQEGMPTTVIEALMTKNIVIASDVGGTKEISLEGDLLLFPAGDILFLQTLLEKAQKNYSQLQGKSYTHIKDTFSWDKSIERLGNLIVNVTGEKK